MHKPNEKETNQFEEMSFWFLSPSGSEYESHGRQVKITICKLRESQTRFDIWISYYLFVT